MKILDAQYSANVTVLDNCEPFFVLSAFLCISEPMYVYFDVKTKYVIVEIYCLNR